VRDTERSVEVTAHTGSRKSRSGPLVAVTPDIETAPSGRLVETCPLAYFDAIQHAGAIPVVPAPIPELAAAHARLFDAFVFTGGNDPAMEDFGKPTHPAATLVHPRRQQYELALLNALRDLEPRRPVLGICLGMQMMTLHAGGDINQHLPDTLPTHSQHKNAVHPVLAAHETTPRWLPALTPLLPAELRSALTVQSNHHQAVSDPGTLLVLARSDDGVIEGVGDPGRPFYLGVQWHPERTKSADLGAGVFEALVRAVAGPR